MNFFKSLETRNFSEQKLTKNYFEILQIDVFQIPQDKFSLLLIEVFTPTFILFIMLVNIMRLIKKFNTKIECSKMKVSVL